MRVVRGKDGFVLVVSVILLLSISVIAAAFVSLVTTRSRAAAYALAGEQAFWLAEAGIQDVIYNVKNDSTYRDDPTNITGSLGGGTYSVSVAKRAGETIYDMTSTGTVGGASKSLSQTATFTFMGWTHPFTDYGSFAGSGNINMRNTATIAGDAYTAGSVSTANSSRVTGTVYADSGSGNYTRLPLPDPPLSSPTLTTTYYDKLIATAGTYIKKDMTYETLSLAGGTVYVNGKVTTENITGPGTVVSTGNFKVDGGTVGQDVTIVSNATLSFAANSTVESGGVLYAKNSFASTASNVIMNGVAILTPGVVNLSNTVTINGAILCKGSLTIGSTVVLNGAVVSGGTMTMTGKGRIVQNKNQLPARVPSGVETDTSVTLSDWQG